MHVFARVQFCIWQICSNLLPTKEILTHRGVDVSPTSLLCEKEEEYI